MANIIHSRLIALYLTTTINPIVKVYLPIYYYYYFIIIMQTTQTKISLSKQFEDFVNQANGDESLYLLKYDIAILKDAIPALKRLESIRQKMNERNAILRDS